MVYDLDNLWQRVSEIEQNSTSILSLMPLAFLAVAIEIRALRRELSNRTADYPVGLYPKETKVGDSA